MVPIARSCSSTRMTKSDVVSARWRRRCDGSTRPGRDKRSRTLAPPSELCRSDDTLEDTLEPPFTAGLAWPRLASWYLHNTCRDVTEIKPPPRLRGEPSARFWLGGVACQDRLRGPVADESLLADQQRKAPRIAPRSSAASCRSLAMSFTATWEACTTTPTDLNLAKARESDSGLRPSRAAMSTLS